MSYERVRGEPLPPNMPEEKVKVCRLIHFVKILTPLLGRLVLYFLNIFQLHGIPKGKTPWRPAFLERICRSQDSH